jgi:hypothetical protein
MDCTRNEAVETPEKVSNPQLLKKTHSIWIDIFFLSCCWKWVSELLDPLNAGESYLAI